MDDNFNEISDKISEQNYNKTNGQLNQQGDGLVDRVGLTMQNTGSAMISSGKAVANVGKGIKTTGKGIETTGKAANTAGKGMQATGKGMQAAGKGLKTVGKGVDTAGAATAKAGKALSSSGAGAIAGVPLTAAGLAGQGVGKGTQAIGTATDVAGKGVEKAGQGAEKAGKSMQTAGDKMSMSGNKLEASGKKFSFGGKKLRDRGLGLRKNEKEPSKEQKNNKKNDDIKSKALKLMHPVEAVKTFVEFKVKSFIVKILLIFLLILVAISLIYSMIFGPIMDALQYLDERVTEVVNFHEKTDNFLNGLGFQNSEGAFYDELDYLYDKYDEELDIPLLMATIFYDDLNSFDDSDMGLEEVDVNDGINGATVLATVRSWVKEKIKESNVTVGEDGLEYSSNKIYRLRKLAKHSFATGMFGSPKKEGKSETVSISEYLDMVQGEIGTELFQSLKKLPSIPNLANPGNLIESLYQIINGDEVFSTTDTGAFLSDNSLTHLYEIIKQILWSTVADVKSVKPCLEDGDILCVTYAKYERSEESYENYLRHYYIRYMPEFKKFLDYSSDAALEKSIEDIIDQIYIIRDEYEEIFGVPEESAEFYSNICQGNLKKSLISELVTPVDISEDKQICFSGTYGYGTSGSLNHRGLDLNSSTTGNKEGDSVYSVYNNGKVTASTADGTYKCDDCKGGWLKITYDAQLSDGAYKFSVIYGGLDPNSLTLKKGDSVEKKGTTVGKIGSTNDSEVIIPSLHYGIYDENSKSYLDPTNQFVSCGNIALRGDSNEEKIWNYLLDYGYSEAGVAGVMGNWMQESSFVPNNVENCATVFDDNTFGSLVKKGTITRSQFAKYVGNGCEKQYPGNTTYALGAYGYGLAQWTYPGRKEKMYDYWKESGMNIDDLEFQLNWYVHEAEGYYGLHALLKTTSSVYDAAKSYESIYEGSLGGLGNRAENAQKIYDKYAGKSQRSTTNNVSDSCNVTGGTSTGTSVSLGTLGLSNDQLLKKLFPNGLPTKESQVTPYLTTISVPLTKKDGTKTTGNLTVHKDVASDVQAIFKEAQDGGFKIYDAAAYNFRPMHNGTSNLSHHSYGIAIDINVNENYSRRGNTVYAGSFWDPSSSEFSIPKDGVLVNAFKKRGWKWGGDWAGNYQDYMHFSLTGN